MKIFLYFITEYNSLQLHSRSTQFVNLKTLDSIFFNIKNPKKVSFKITWV